jgi:hypothetical protein
MKLVHHGQHVFGGGLRLDIMYGIKHKSRSGAEGAYALTDLPADLVDRPEGQRV